MKSWFSALALTLVWATCFSLAQGRACSDNEDCVLLQQCPAKLGGVSPQGCDAGIVEDICDHENGAVKVCCAKCNSSAPDLPAQCGRQPVRHIRTDKNHHPPFGAYPWMVHLKVKNGESEIIISGVLINARLVLTEAWPFLPDGSNIVQIVYGARDVSVRRQCVLRGATEHQCFGSVVVNDGAEEVVKHPQHGWPYLRDAVLVRLRRPVDFASREALAEPVCLPTAEGNRTLKGQRGLLVAWDQQGRDPLLRTDLVHIVDRAECKPHFTKISNWTNWICATSEPDTTGRIEGGILLLEGAAEPPVVTVWGILGGYTDDRSHLLFESVLELRDWILKNL